MNRSSTINQQINLSNYCGATRYFRPRGFSIAGFDAFGFYSYSAEVTEVRAAAETADIKTSVTINKRNNDDTKIDATNDTVIVVRL